MIFFQSDKISLWNHFVPFRKVFLISIEGGAYKFRWTPTTFFWMTKITFNPHFVRKILEISLAHFVESWSFAGCIFIFILISQCFAGFLWHLQGYGDESRPVSYISYIFHFDQRLSYRVPWVHFCDTIYYTAVDFTDAFNIWLQWFCNKWAPLLFFLTPLGYI